MILIPKSKMQIRFQKLLCLKVKVLTIFKTLFANY